MNDFVIKIKYFPFGGRGTALRLAAYIGNIPFEDEFISFEDFKKIQHQHNIKWMTLPQITIYDKCCNKIIIGQSNNCLRYIGKKSNLYPSNNSIFSSFCDEIMDYVEDIMILLAPSEFCRDEQKKIKQRKELSKHKLPIYLQKLEWRLQENLDRGYNKGYIVGDTLTITDCKLYCFIRHFGHCEWREGYYNYINENILDNYPLLTEYKSFIGNLPAVNEFNIKWRKRQKGFKLGLPEYGKCHLFNNDIQKHVQNDTDYTKLVIFVCAAILLLLSSIININSNNDDHSKILANVPTDVPAGAGAVLLCFVMTVNCANTLNQ